MALNSGNTERKGKYTLKQRMDRRTKPKFRKNPQKMLAKFWYFLWEEDSVWSWIANIIVAFVVIKFLVYPGLGLIVGTQFPIVAVVSGSMEHQGDFDDWWQSQENLYGELSISKEQFQSFPLVDGFNKGDIMMLKQLKKENIKIGQVVVFHSTHASEPVIHRIVDVHEGSFTTKGDFNNRVHSFEKKVGNDKIIGQAYFRIPYLGYIKIWFVTVLRAIGLMP